MLVHKKYELWKIVDKSLKLLNWLSFKKYKKCIINTYS